jgi:hypothetical protein
MRLNLPIDLSRSSSVLITGVGGGFDVFAGLPLFYELRKSHSLHLANYSFAPLAAGETVINGVLNRLYEVGEVGYHPEGWLATVLSQEERYENGVWQIAKLGSKPVHDAYKHILETCAIDTVLLVDGGVDSLMHGDEDGAGTLLEDSVVLAALEDFNGVRKILVTVGFGTEIEEKVCHSHVLENIAELTRDGHCFGSCALTPRMDCFQFYKWVYDWCAFQDGFKHSHITSRIIPAVEGVFGGEHFLNPLMGLYWFFEAHAVMARNKLIPLLRNTHLFSDAMLLYRQWLAQGGVKRASKNLPY